MNSKIVKFLKRNSLVITIVLIGFFIRLIYGLSVNFAEVNTKYLQDYTQIYLLGLKFYTTNFWPYFGPDITYTFSQIPGGLQSILVGFPFYFLSVPEAPFYFINLLSISALCFMAWYVSKRFLDIPTWFIYAWLLTAPWTMNFSTTIINPSFLLAPSILFFISVLEVLPIYEHKIIKSNIAFFLTGISLAWIFQLHMSWVLLPFFLIYSFYFEWKLKNKNQVLKSLLFFLIGFLLLFVTVIPTYIKYGISAGNAGESVSFNLENLKNIDIFTRFFALSSFDVRQFINGDWNDEVNFISNNSYAIPFLIFGYLMGLLQIIWCIINIFKRSEDVLFKRLRTFVLLAISLTYLSYLFAVREVATYTFYILLPISFFYSFYITASLFRTLIWRRIAILFIFSNLIFHFSLATTYYKDQSLFTKRELINKAIKQNDSRVFAYRRIPTWERLARENQWQCFTINKIENKKLICKLDFDHFPNEILPEALNNSSYKSAPYSFQLDSIFEQSVVLSKNINELNGYHKVKVSIDLCYPTINNAVLVLNEQVKDSLVFWKQINVGNSKQKENLWHQVIFETEFLPLMNQDAKLDIIVWLPRNSNNTKVLIDNFKVEFY